MKEKEKERMKLLGKYLADLRETKNVSVKELAKATGISDPYLYQVEKGQKRLTDPDFITRIADFFSIDVEEILKKAGYLPENNHEREIEKEYSKCINDPDFKGGIFLNGKEVPFEAKLFIIELYSKIEKPKKTIDQIIAESAKTIYPDLK
jgi:transcriptional regulator with XRE-family HTH domain